MKFFRLRASFDRPADATQYSAGDEVSNHATAASVVRPTFDLSGFVRGRIHALSFSVAAASGDVVTTGTRFEFTLWLPGDEPAAVGDNVTNPIAASTLALSVGRYDNTGDASSLLNPLGAVAAGTSQYSRISTYAIVPLAAPAQSQYLAGYPFDFTGKPLANRYLTLVTRVRNTWNPGAVVNTIGVTLDVMVE